MGLSFPKLALILAVIAALIGVFFFGRSTGKDSERVVYQTKVIQAGERHAEIEQRQSAWDSKRVSVDHIKWLHEGSF